jgi:hypothetical protein
MWQLLRRLRLTRAREITKLVDIHRSLRAAYVFDVARASRCRVSKIEGPLARAPDKMDASRVGGSGGLRPHRHDLRDAVPQSVEALRGLGADECCRALRARGRDIALLAQMVDVDLIGVGE